MSQSITGIIDWLNDWLEEKSNKVSSWSSTTSDTRYPSEKLVKDSLDGKSDFNHLHPISDITTPIYSSSQIDTMLQNIKGDTATDVMDKVGMMYALRNETTHNISSLITSYYQGIMEFGLSSVLEDYIIDGVEGVYEIRDYRFPDLFYYYDGTNLTCLTPTKIRLTCTDYNPDINSTVTVRAELTDMFDNSIPFENLRLEIEQGGVGNSVDLITDSNGVATYNYSCSSWGVCRFSIKTFVAYINIGNPYPVGSIYISMNNVNPSTLFGGTWEKIEGRFLLGSSSTHTLGSTGGEETHTLTIAEMPTHNHTQTRHRHDMDNVWSSGSGSQTAYMTTSNRGRQERYTSYEQPAIQNTGGGGAHNNMPPFLTVNLWKRIN